MLLSLYMGYGGIPVKLMASVKTNDHYIIGDKLLLNEHETSSTTCS